jgi:YrbI family 3-deoxy-D-manno-octulosonate 8-phosphate phosphatase
LVLSTEKNKVVYERCKKLNIDCIQGSENKITDLEKWLKKLNLRIQNTIFVGNDINDEDCLNKAGCSVVVQDAHEEIHKVADIILSKPGGRGAVRELADLIYRKMRIKK